MRLFSQSNLIKAIKQSIYIHENIWKIKSLNTHKHNLLNSFCSNGYFYVNIKQQKISQKLRERERESERENALITERE